MTRKTLLNRNTRFFPPMPRAREPTWLHASLECLCLWSFKKGCSRNGLKRQARLNHRLHKLHFWRDRKALIYSEWGRLHKGPWRHSFAEDQPECRESGRSRAATFLCVAVWHSHTGASAMQSQALPHAFPYPECGAISDPKFLRLSTSCVTLDKLLNLDLNLNFFIYKMTVNKPTYLTGLFKA